MPKSPERYTLEEAQNEASRIQEKVEKKGRPIPRAEREVMQEKLIEQIENILNSKQKEVIYSAESTGENTIFFANNKPGKIYNLFIKGNKEIDRNFVTKTIASALVENGGVVYTDSRGKYFVQDQFEPNFFYEIECADSPGLDAINQKKMTCVFADAGEDTVRMEKGKVMLERYTKNKGEKPIKEELVEFTGP